MDIDGKTRLFGLVGHGIAYTLSPLIHNSAARLLKKNAVYVPFDVSIAALPRLLTALWEIGAFGFNVTKPHKEAVAKLIQADRQASSINTVTRGPDGWTATSTDGLGFERAVCRAGFDLEYFTDYVFLGNGGAVLALVAHLAAKPGLLSGRRLHIVRRSFEKDHKFRELLPLETPLCNIDFRAFEPTNLSTVLSRPGRFLLIQGTSGPLSGDALNEFALAIPQFDGLVFDLVYGHPSAILTRAGIIGVACMDGLPMLIEQARASQEIWWQKSAPYDDLFRICHQ